MSLAGYNFYPKLIVRSPLQSIEKKNHHINDIASNEFFNEAIFLSSSGLYKEYQKLLTDPNLSQNEKSKISQTVNKYWSRMCTRTTPFGLFAASGVAEWSSDENQKSEILFSESKFNRRTRLDMHFLCQLANMMEDDPEIQCHLKYFPNSSIYIIGDDYRFLESSNSTGRTNFNISAVSKSSHLDKLLSMAKNGVTLIELMDELCRSENIGRDDAALYVSELAESQLIISEFEPSVTGEEYIKSMEATLKRISEEFDSAPARKYLDKINSLMVMLKDLDNQVLNDVERYKDICNEAQTFGFEVNPERMVQVDSFLNIEKSAISPKVQTHLLEGMSALLKCVKPYENTNIQTFIKRFTERYENREISLCEALDSETGIGYPSRLASDTSALTEDISYEIDSDKQTVWDTYENWVFRTLIDAEKQGTYEFILDDEQLSSFPEQKEELVPTIGLMFRVVDNQENIVQIESGSGSSAVNLLGRFGHGDEEIATMISELAKIEEEKNPEVIFAEIAHLPESRTGNVLQRPNLRSYEIPYLAKSTLNDEYQVSIQDLYIKIVKGNIQLHSRRLKKRVIPRLSTAHNFGRSDLPIYKFLCDLQLHEKQSIIAFNWGSAKDKFVFFPRVKYKKAILHRATWRFKREHIAELVNTKDNGERMNKVFEFRSLWQLPRYVVLADGDNELHVDLFAEDDIKMLIDAVKKREDFIIKEFLGQQNSVIRDANNASYTNQMVACLFNEQQTYDTRVAQVVANNPSKEVARKFAPGSEWVYYKFYCGDRIADTVLREVIRDKVKDLLGDDLIDKWFFIRYNDGQPHFRFRVHLTDIIHFSRVVAEISIAIRQLTEENIIWRVEMSTYEREMERYGKHTIELAEDIFHHDSNAILDLLTKEYDEDMEDIRWKWLLKAIDDLFESFEIPLAERLEISELFRESFMKEFEVDKDLRLKLDKKYRQHQNHIKDILDGEADKHLGELTFSLYLRKMKISSLSSQFKNYLEGSNLRLYEVLGSLIHMTINRTMVSRQRFYEMIIYYFMSKYYKSKLARLAYSDQKELATA